MDEQEWQSFTGFEEECSAAERKLDFPDNIQIFVQTVDGKTILVDVHPTSTIANIKNTVRTKASCVCGADTFLIFGGKVLEDESTVSEIGLQKEALLVEVGRLLGGAPKTRTQSSMAAGNFDPAETDKAHDEDPTLTASVRLGGMLRDMNLGDPLGPPAAQGAEKDLVCVVY